MKKYFLICTIILLMVLLFSGIGFADRWGIHKRGVYSPFFGSPINVRSIQLTGEHIKNNTAYYTYKFIIDRPNRDDGWGRANYNGLNLRLYYWAALTGTDPYSSLYTGKTVYQKTHANPRMIVVHVMEGLKPSRNPYYIRVGILPYPMVGNHSCRDFIQVYRSDYVSFLKSLITKSNIYGVIGDFALGKLKDGVIDSTLDRAITYYGQVVKLEVNATMPNLLGVTSEKAAHMLRERTLIPRPLWNQYIPTSNKAMQGRVAWQQYAWGNRLQANTQVEYRLYKYMGEQNQLYTDKEICGDGIDNNGNNQIDEGCNFEREIILDDNQCRDDTIGLIVDDRRFGVTPPGHKRHFNLSGLTFGEHRVTVVAVKSGGKPYKCADNRIVSYSIKLGKGIYFSDGSSYKSAEIQEGTNKVYGVIVK